MLAPSPGLGLKTCLETIQTATQAGPKHTCSNCTAKQDTIGSNKHFAAQYRWTSRESTCSSWSQTTTLCASGNLFATRQRRSSNDSGMSTASGSNSLLQLPAHQRHMFALTSARILRPSGRCLPLRGPLSLACGNGLGAFSCSPSGSGNARLLLLAS